jgi:hypothetical protein
MTKFWKLLVGNSKNKTPKTQGEEFNSLTRASDQPAAKVKSTFKTRRGTSSDHRQPSTNSHSLPKTPEQETLEFLAGLRPEDILALQYPALLKKRDDRIAEIELELPGVEEELATLYQRRAETLQLIQVANRQQPLTLNRSSQSEGGEHAD